MDRQLEKSHGNLFLYMTSEARLLSAKKWKGSTLSTMEEWLAKMMELREMNKLISLIREKVIFTFMAAWKPLIDLLRETRKNTFMTCDFDN